MTRRLPAYARELVDARRRGLVPVTPTGWLIVALGWPMHRRIAVHHPRVVVPVDADPRDLDFRFSAGLDVLLAHAPLDRADAHALGDALWACRPRSLTAAPVPCEPPDRYRYWHAAPGGDHAGGA